jgi:hypothetical protein
MVAGARDHGVRGLRFVGSGLRASVFVSAAMGVGRTITRESVKSVTLVPIAAYLNFVDANVAWWL